MIKCSCQKSSACGHISNVAPQELLPDVKLLAAIHSLCCLRDNTDGGDHTLINLLLVKEIFILFRSSLFFIKALFDPK